MAIPEHDRPRYGHMPEHLYWEMLEGEDPDDRAIREAHGFGYEDDYEDRSLLCRNGCGRTYFDIATGKARECAAREGEPMNEPDIQHFTENGTWVKPGDAVRVEITLKGGTGGGSLPGGGGGHGGDSSLIPAVGLLAGGGGGGGGFGYMLAVSPAIPASVPKPERHEVGAGGEGATVTDSFAAGALPDRMPVKVGEGGFARIITHLKDDADEH